MERGRAWDAGRIGREGSGALEFCLDFAGGFDVDECAVFRLRSCWDDWTEVGKVGGLEGRDGCTEVKADWAGMAESGDDSNWRSLASSRAILSLELFLIHLVNPLELLIRSEMN